MKNKLLHLLSKTLAVMNTTVKCIVITDSSSCRHMVEAAGTWMKKNKTPLFHCQMIILLRLLQLVHTRFQFPRNIGIVASYRDSANSSISSVRIMGKKKSFLWVDWAQDKGVNKSVQLLSRVQLCNLMDWSQPGFPVHQQFSEPTQTHFHHVGDAIQPPHPLVPFSHL